MYYAIVIMFGLSTITITMIGADTYTLPIQHPHTAMILPAVGQYKNPSIHPDRRASQVGM